LHELNAGAWWCARLLSSRRRSWGCARRLRCVRCGCCVC
jgi:hypothetical protein